MPSVTVSVEVERSVGNLNSEIGDVLVIPVLGSRWGGGAIERGREAQLE